MNKNAFKVQPSLIRLALGIPTGALGGLFGYMTAPKGHRLEGMARGAGIGYMAGTGAGVGAMLGDAAAPEGNTPAQNVPYMLSGGLAGGVLGLGVGSMMQGPPQWEKQRKLREELLDILREEQDKLRKELNGQNPVKVLQKISRDENLPALVEFAAKHPELAMLPAGGAVGAALAEKKKNPIMDTIRGMLTGLATAAGTVSGSAIGRRLAEDPSTGTLGGGAIGGLLTYLAARQALKDIGREKTSAPNRVLKTLIEAKQLSDRKDYKGKHTLLRQLIEKYPDDFYIDSVSGDIVGITHQPTGFKIHAPIKVLPVKLRGSTDVEAAVS